MRTFLCGVLLLLAACHTETVASTPVPDACRTVLHVPGPEDFAVHRTASPRLYVSSQERRGKPLPRGGIYSISFQANSVITRRLRLAGRDRCSFHPHGISLAPRGAGGAFLYVINHHDAADASPARGCFPLAAGSLLQKRPVTSIEVFQVEPERLVFLRRLADPEVLTNGNDLVALPDGQIWVTNPPPGLLTQLLEPLTGEQSKIVHFACPAGQTPPCTGIWREAARLDGFANGIAFRKEGERLYVASTRNREIRVYETSGGHPKSIRPVALDAYPDNLEWSEDGKSLLVAAHADLRRFLQHSRAPQVPSPSEVWRVPIDQKGAPDLVFREEGGLVSAASTAACAGQDLFLGQVFGPGVWRCARARVCTAPAPGMRLVPGRRPS